MFNVVIDIEKCESCGDCIEVCPTDALTMVAINGKQVTQYTGEPDDCIGCYTCSDTCPEEAIEVLEA
jgi:NAD-dependent dihydropyrimidine dehydrogenase PreA subunit